MATSPLIAPQFFSGRVAVLYFTLFLPMGLYLPFFPLWLDYLSFSHAEIGLIVGIPVILRVFTTPWLTAQADRSRDRVHMLIAITVVALFLAALHLFAQSFWSVLLLSVILAVAWAPQIPIADSIAVSGVRRYGAEYPKMRVWGSISFLVMNLAAGAMMEHLSPGAFPWILLGSYLAVLIWGLFGAPRIGQKRELGDKPLSLSEKKHYLASPYFVLTLIAVACSQGGHSFLYTFGTIEWQRNGFSGGTIGLLWSFSVLAEVGIFFTFARLIKHLSGMKLMMIVACFGVLRWGMMAHGDLYGHILPVYLALQALHAFTFAASYLVLQKVIADTIPEELSGAAQGLSYFALGAMMGLGSILSGPLYAAFGEKGFWAMALLSIVGLIAASVNVAYERSMAYK